MASFFESFWLHLRKGSRYGGEVFRLWSQAMWVHIPALPLFSGMTLDKFLKLLFHLYNNSGFLAVLF